MKKFAAIFAAVLLTVSVLVVSASAKLFADDTQYLYSSIVGGIGHYNSSSGNVSGNPMRNVTSFSVLRSGKVIFTYGFSEPVTVYTNNYNGSTLHVPEFYYGTDFEPIYSSVDIGYYDTVKFYSTDSSITGFDAPTQVVVPAGVSSLSSSVFSVGGSLLTFITSSWLTLVALGAFVLVLCIGVIRRLVKGV